jgi:hypothetical protein
MAARFSRGPLGLPNQSSPEAGPKTAGQAPATASQRAENPPNALEQGSGGETPDRDTVGVAAAKRLILLVTGLGLLFAVVRIWRQPKNIPEARDSEAFRKALRDLAPEIQRRANTPREMRRFMNLLRFIAGPSDSDKPSEAAGFEPQLVQLAARGVTTQKGEMDPRIIEYYRTQCELIGVDPETFQSREEG